MHTNPLLSLPRHALCRWGVGLSMLMTAGLALAADPSGCGPRMASDGVTRATPFVLAESFIFQGKPELSRYGIQTFKILDRGMLKDGPNGQTADPERIQGLAQGLPKGDEPVVLDIESFNFTVDDATAQRGVDALSGVLKAFRSAAPGRSFGFYGAIPVRDYWRAMKGIGSGPYADWQAQNNRLRELARQVDIIFPSVYTFYEDRAGWVRYATAQICEARRVSDKPVYIFIWNEYHDSNKTRQYTFLERDYWRLELETAFRLADGVVMWGGYDMGARKPRVWDEQAAWWEETKFFAQKVLKNPRAAK
ncbi:hypothetical protein KAK06_05205 [Ideonella sp. 4Y11]|uniref:Hyaluronidase n=1 Tax=Ideonella aquatica TaxID=2824119 RepID=A0A941BIZ8_9BURK|nr:hypothetical protein [Ideonella aquatica]MBQ0958348.1 hypothetical protein [Ideonella aquatica]